MYELNPIKKTINITHIATASEPAYDENFSFNGENHNFWEMVYVLEGAICATADEKVFQLSEGEIIFHKPMEFHKLWSHRNTKPHLFIMSFQAEGELMEYFKDGVFKLDAASKNALNVMLTYLRDCQKDEPEHYNYFLIPWNRLQYYGEKLGALLTCFLLTVAESSSTLTDVMESKSAQIYNKVINTMKAHVNGTLSVKDIASKCNISQSYLKKIFARYSTYTIHRYFTVLKIQEAISLLSKDYSVLEISDILSFNNQNYFSIVFKRETGYSPMKYKNEFLKQKINTDELLLNK